MKRILVINPNTSSAITERVLSICRQAHPDLGWDASTARFGAPYIASEAAYAVAGHAVLDAFASDFNRHDAVLIACFGDPGLLALRELSPVPVSGLAEASFVAAAALGPFAVVTGGRAWAPMLARFARTHQLDAHLRAICTVSLTGAEIAAAPQDALQALEAAGREGLSAGAGSILLGGAGLAGMASMLQARLGVPVMDNVLAAANEVARQAHLSHLRAGQTPSMGMTGLSDALQRLMG